MHWYGQHREDEKIAELLGWDGKRPLFYIDIGAWHHTADSVTKAFYDAGSRGINIEPQPSFFTELCIERPRDINLPYGISSTGGGERHPFAEIEGGGLSTFDPRWATKWSNARRGTLSVPIYTLAEICDAHVPRASNFYEIKPGSDLPRDLAIRKAWDEGGPDAARRLTPPIAIDFLKIDVEGWEYHVIKGGDWERYRPTILCIEATEPGTDRPMWDEWEPLVLEVGYRFEAMTGVNRYYRDARP